MIIRQATLGVDLCERNIYRIQSVLSGARGVADRDPTRQEPRGETWCGDQPLRVFGQRVAMYATNLERVGHIALHDVFLHTGSDTREVDARRGGRQCTPA